MWPCPNSQCPSTKTSSESTTSSTTSESTQSTISCSSYTTQTECEAAYCWWDVATLPSCGTFQGFCLGSGEDGCNDLGTCAQDPSTGLKFKFSTSCIP